MGRISQLLISIAVTTLYCCCCYSCCNVQTVDAHQGLAAFINHRTQSLVTNSARPSLALLNIPRGGGSGDDESDYDDEYDSDIEEEEEEEKINLTKSLKSSTLKASSKAKKQKTSSSKKVVNESLSTKKKSKAVKKAKRRLLFIPYIMKAFLNPFTVFAMTKGYFASLFNIDYLQEVRNGI